MKKVVCWIEMPDFQTTSNWFTHIRMLNPNTTRKCQEFFYCWGPRMNYLALAENLEVVDLGSQSKGKLDFSNQIKFPKTSQFFCQINFFTKKVTNAHCGNYGNLLSLKKISSNHLFSSFFSKTVTFTKFLPKMRESEFP